MTSETKTKINEIRRRITEYHKHKNDPFAYHEGEISAVREVRENAVQDIEFLLSLLDKKS